MMVNCRKPLYFLISKYNNEQNSDRNKIIKTLNPREYFINKIIETAQNVIDSH